MKYTLVLGLPFVIAVCNGQSVDTLSIKMPGSRFFSYPSPSGQADGNQNETFSYQAAKPRLVSKGNLLFTTYHFQMPPIEIEISDLEASECTALLKRDMSVLKTLWLRDFTLQDPLNELVDGTNPLPYLISLFRFVESCNIWGTMVNTSGYEVVQRLKTDGNVEEPFKRKFSHTWVKNFGSWKLSSKTHK